MKFGYTSAGLLVHIINPDDVMRALCGMSIKASAPSAMMPGCWDCQFVNDNPQGPVRIV